MKRLVLAILLLSVSSTYAGPLDLIYDAPGSFWGRVDASPNSSTDLTHTQFQLEQGFRFEHLTWLTWYGAFTWWQQVDVSQSGYWSAGVKNTTWIPHITIGIEEQGYVISEPTPVVDSTIIVGYISASLDWNLMRKKYY